VVSVFIGFDPREVAAFAVARESVKRHAPRHWNIQGLVLSELQKSGLYTRPMEMRPSELDPPIMWDVISDHSMSTQHANARFLVPYIAKQGWAVFMDGDMMVRTNLSVLSEQLDKSKAVYCVQHRHEPTHSGKMDGQIQSRYARKNWTSFIVFNCDHPANAPLVNDTTLANTLPGRDLHRLCWLRDEDIGELDCSWNWLAGVSDPEISPDIIHWTNGTPDMRGYEDVPYADQWREELARWAA